MPYLYHLKPEPMRGDTLYPLNQLKHVDPALYRRQLAKYDDHPRRKTLPNRVIPKLDCLWNDVLHFSPVHPCLIYQAWLELGKKLKETTFYRVPVAQVAAHPAVIYTLPQKKQLDTNLPESCVEWLDTTAFTELEVLPPATVEWYARLRRRKQVGGFFVGIPHVLVKGAVKINEENSIGWC